MLVVQMSKKEPDNRFYFSIVAMVAIVGIVSMLILFTSSDKRIYTGTVNTKSVGSQDLVGEAHQGERLSDWCHHCYDYCRSIGCPFALCNDQGCHCQGCPEQPE